MAGAVLAAARVPTALQRCGPKGPAWTLAEADRAGLVLALAVWRRCFTDADFCRYWGVSEADAQALAALADLPLDLVSDGSG
jgi:hypothetical protein